MTSWLFVYTSVLLTAVYKMANRVGLNKNVSTSALTRAERAQINELQVLPIEPLSRSNKSIVWKYTHNRLRLATE